LFRLPAEVRFFLHIQILSRGFFETHITTIFSSLIQTTFEDGLKCDCNQIFEVWMLWLLKSNFKLSFELLLKKVKTGDGNAGSIQTVFNCDYSIKHHKFNIYQSPVLHTGRLFGE